MEKPQNSTLNGLIPLGATNAVSAVTNSAKRLTNTIARNTNALVQNTASYLPTGIPWFGLAIFVVLVLIFVIFLRIYHTQIGDGLQKFVTSVRSTFGYSVQPPEPSEVPSPTTQSPPAAGDVAVSPTSIVEKVLPQGGQQVFNVSKNTFTYYDAEPLCKALGAELATYEQVKESWEKGADWCNYGWTKGQLAVYPTQKETWEKLQHGPEDQRNACGNPGMNGGFFDNPELHFGVNCYGTKPSQSDHDASQVARGKPQTAGELEFDKKVSHFRSESDSIGILPFNNGKWNAT